MAAGGAARNTGAVHQDRAAIAVLVDVESMLAGDSVHYFGSSAKTAITEIEALYAEVMTVLKMPRTRK